MALHATLNIYKVAYQFLVEVSKLTAQFPRNFRASMGEQIRTEAVRLVVLVIRANTARAKGPYLEELLERLQVIEVLIRLSTDMRFMSDGQYAKAIELTSSIGKQANGWRKASHV